MRVLTYSVVIGSAKCNLRCPFCVAVMTPHYEVEPINVENLIAGAELAIRGGATTLLLTGKGEPTLFPDQITEVLTHLKGKFPIVELQTNGLEIASGRIDGALEKWRSLGLKTIALSVVHWEAEKNRLMNPRWDQMPNLEDLLRRVHRFGFMSRLSVVMVKGGIDSAESVRRMIDFARMNKVGQLTLRPVTRPDEADGKVSSWIEGNSLSESIYSEIQAGVLDPLGATLLMRLPHGADVFDIAGQNVSITNCLTLNPTSDDIRQLIYCSDGHIRYDWRYQGAILF